MLIRTGLLVLVCFALGACDAPAKRGMEAGSTGMATLPEGGARVPSAEPLVAGETFLIDSPIMGEARRINVLVPSIYGQKIESPMPVLYMLDGGMDEDFLHVAGLVQVLVGNGGMRPFMLVGIQNTARRRDLTGPTSSAEDKKIAPVVGGSATFRRFIKEELMPTIRGRYRTTREAAIVGESLAGLFVVETFFLEPDLFDSYIAFDPSLWWANQELLRSAEDRLAAVPGKPMSVFIASSSEPEVLKLTSQLADIVQSHRDGRLAFHFAPLPAETHATIYHPAALLAFRTVFAPPAPMRQPATPADVAGHP